MMMKRINNSLINSYCDRINVSGISLDRKALRNKFNNLDSDAINNYMIGILNNNNKNIISTLTKLGVSAKANKRISTINTIMDEMKKHFPNSEITYNQDSNTFSITGNENITLKLVKENDKYSVQKVTTQENNIQSNNFEENTNASNTNSKGKQYTLSNGKQSSKLFVNDEMAQ